MRLGDQLANCPEGFEELPVLFVASWSEWEEDGWVVVFDFLGELMVCEYQYSVMAEDNCFHFDPRPLQAWEIPELREEWAPYYIELDELN